MILIPGKQASTAMIEPVDRPILAGRQPEIQAEAGLPHPDWPQLLHDDWDRWLAAVKAAENGPDVLVATSTGANSLAANVESMLAVALTLRGARVHTLLCDELLPACDQAMSHLLPAARLVDGSLRSQVCRGCFGQADAMYSALGLPHHRYSDLLTTDERSEARSLAATLPADSLSTYQWRSLAVGEHALAGALRFFGRGDLGGEPLAESVLRRYFEASMLTTLAMQRLFGMYEFKGACFNHGIYVPHGLIGEVARRANVPVVNWNAAYRKQTFIFSHGDTYHHTLMREPTAN